MPALGSPPEEVSISSGSVWMWPYFSSRLYIAMFSIGESMVFQVAHVPPATHVKPIFMRPASSTSTTSAILMLAMTSSKCMR